MADYSCEWCSKEKLCKYSYNETDCIPQKQVELVSKITPKEINEFELLITELTSKDEDIFHEVINAYRNIINEYPNDEELEYAKEILS